MKPASPNFDAPFSVVLIGVVFGKTIDRNVLKRRPRRYSSDRTYTASTRGRFVGSHLYTVADRHGQGLPDVRALGHCRFDA